MEQIKSRTSVVQENEPERSEQQVVQQDSPKSDKSVDSGRESRSDSDDSSREDDDDVQERERNDVQNAQKMSSVRNIVNGMHKQFVGGVFHRRPSIFSGFESRSVPVTHLPKPSRLPPRIPAKPRLPTSQIPTLLGESSPRPLQKSLALASVPSLPKSSPPRMSADSR